MTLLLLSFAGIVAVAYLDIIVHKNRAMLAAAGTWQRARFGVAVAWFGCAGFALMAIIRLPG